MKSINLKVNGKEIKADIKPILKLFNFLGPQNLIN